MKKIVLLFSLFLVSALAGLAQGTHHKIIVRNSPSLRHRDGLHQRIEVLSTYCTDSTTDMQLVEAAMHSGLFLLPLYALNANDTTRIAAMITCGAWGGVVMRFDNEGNIISTAFYDAAGRPSRTRQEFYPHMRMKSYGRYRHGKRVGAWRYYDVAGRMTKKEKYRGGVLVSSKTISHPHRTWITIFHQPNSDPVDYKLLEPGDTQPVTFPSDSSRVSHAAWGFGEGVSYEHADLRNLRAQPWMVGHPSDNVFMFGSEAFVGVREKMFVSGSLYFGFSSDRGYYSPYGTVHVNLLNVQYSVAAHVPVLKRPHTGLFVYAGACWRTTDVESFLFVTPNGNNPHFEDNAVRQQPLISTGVDFDWSRHPKRNNFASYLALHAGYNFSVTSAEWYAGGMRTGTAPKVDLGGFFVGVSIRQWHVKKKLPVPSPNASW